MIDDQVNSDEMAESNKQRLADETATNEGMQELQGDAASALYALQPVPPMRWIRHAKEWFGAGAGFSRAK